MSLVEVSTTCIELCHTYAPNRTTPLRGVSASGELEFEPLALSELHTRLGSLEEIVRRKYALGSEAIDRLGFLDEVEVRQKQRASDDPARWGLFIWAARESLKQGIIASQVLEESQFQVQAKELQQAISFKARAEVISFNQKGSVKLPTNFGQLVVPILGFKGVEDEQFPSCALFDLAWTKWRVQNYERTFTVLPIDFLKQQQQVAALAAFLELPKRESVTSIFLNSKGEIVSELNFGSVKILEPS